MKRFFRFSLLSMGIAMLAMAACVYYVVPIHQEIYCDIVHRDSHSLGDRCDIYVRNRNGKFQRLLANISVLAVEIAEDQRKGTRRMTIESTVRNRQSLRNYEILQVRRSK